MPLRDKEGLEGRNRFVRVALTEDEHALVRTAAALADLSISQFAIRAIVETAQKTHELAGFKPPRRAPKQK